MGWWGRPRCCRGWAWAWWALAAEEEGAELVFPSGRGVNCVVLKRESILALASIWAAAAAEGEEPMKGLWLIIDGCEDFG